MMYGTFARQAVLAAAVISATSLAATATAAAQARGTFDRSLKVTGAVELSVTSGSGAIRVVTGSADVVRIAARITADNSWFAGNDVEQRIRHIEQHPPIDQQGNLIRVGWFADRDIQQNISISYDITVPEQTRVTAKTGSGSVDIGSVRGAVDVNSGSGSIVVGRAGGAVVASAGSGSLDIGGGASLDAHTGSGSIRAVGIAGPTTAKSGSGTIRIDLTGKGDVDASAASGGGTVPGGAGGLRVTSSRGSVAVTGRPRRPWTIRSSSGSVIVRLPADAAFDLDAHASSGRVDSAHPVTMTGRIDKGRIQGQVRGGGPLVEIRSSSGGVRIQ